jgi:hypothetical protein
MEARGFGCAHGLLRIEEVTFGMITFFEVNECLRETGGMFLRALLVPIALVLVAAGFSTGAMAQTGGDVFVASNGDDTAICSAAAPCRTLGKAAGVIGANGRVTCLDGGNFMPFTITQSVTINCDTGHSYIGSGGAGLTGITIAIPVSASDPLRTVRIRGIGIYGAASSTGTGGSGGGGAGINRTMPRGILITSAAAVFLENVVVSDAQQQGILDQRTGGQTKLFIKDTIVSNNGGAGIGLGSQGPNTNVLDNVSSEYNAYGIAAATGNNVLINRSVFSGNSTAGIEADFGAQIAVNNSTISHNNIGVQSSGSVRLSNNDIAFNSIAISGPSGTFGNNRFSGNSSIGTAPTPLGGATSDVGQQ